MIREFRNRVHYFLSDSKFSEILHGSAWALPAQVVAILLGLLTTAIITRFYGVEMVGILAIVQAFMLFATIFTVMGTNVSILRMLPEHIAKYSISSGFNVYRKTLLLVTSISVLVGFLLFLVTDIIAINIFGKSYLYFYFSLATFFIVVKSIMDLNIQAVRGLRMIRTFAFFQVLPSLALLLSLITISIVHGGANSPVYAQMAAWCITAISSTWVLFRVFRLRMGVKDCVENCVEVVSTKDILKVSMPMFITCLLYTSPSPRDKRQSRMPSSA